MKKTTFTRTVLGSLLGTALLGAGYYVGMHRSAGAPPSEATITAADSGSDKKDPDTGRKVLYWHDPMVPAQHFDKPGKSPFMDMPLQPVYADDEGNSSGIKIDSQVKQNLGIRYAKVHRQEVQYSFQAVGTTQFDESRTSVIQSRVTGYIDRLDASAPMQRIAKGAPIASIYVPDWLAPQEEYLALKRGGSDESLLAASRARMRALSIPQSMIAALDRADKVQTHIVLSAPQTGVVSELNVRDGAMVTPGQTIAKLAGLSTLWLIVDIPEARALDVHPGMTIDASFSGDMTRHFTGRIREILPGINPSSRTLQARMEIDNKSLSLTPGMLMRMQVGGKSASRLLVPSEAIIATGSRTVVIVKNDDGRMRPATVTTGQDFGSETEVLSGLGEGETVVASGQFLIDSEASLKSILPRLEGEATKPAGDVQ